MLFLYELGTYIGYFFIMLLFMIMSIIFAERKSAWIFYGIGAVLQLMSLCGNQKVAQMRGDNLWVEWSIYILLLFGFAIAITVRYNNHLGYEYNEGYVQAKSLSELKTMVQKADDDLTARKIVGNQKNFCVDYEFLDENKLTKKEIIELIDRINKG